MFSKKISYGNYENLSDVKKIDGFYHITNDNFPNFTFVGTEKPDNPKLGSIVFDSKTGLCSAYLDNRWIDLTATTYDTYLEPKVEYRELKPSICSCCGAPLRSNKCEYCDMEYR